MLLEKMEAIRSWHYKIPPYISRHLSTKSFVEDLVSPLLHILSPPTLRPVMYLNFIYYYYFFWERWEVGIFYFFCFFLIPYIMFAISYLLYTLERRYVLQYLLLSLVSTIFYNHYNGMMAI